MSFSRRATASTGHVTCTLYDLGPSEKFEFRIQESANPPHTIVLDPYTVAHHISPKIYPWVTQGLLFEAVASNSILIPNVQTGLAFGEIRYIEIQKSQLRESNL